jgi:hypothetical protein
MNVVRKLEEKGFLFLAAVAWWRKYQLPLHL